MPRHRRQNGRATIHIGRAGEMLTAIEADGALFVDDDRAILWTVDGSRTDLREVLVAAPETTSWQLRVTGLSTPTMSLDAQSKRWRLASRAGVTLIETREGVIGTEQIVSYRWNVPEGHSSIFIFMPIALSGDRMLAIEPRPDLTLPGGILWALSCSCSRAGHAGARRSGRLARIARATSEHRASSSSAINCRSRSVEPARSSTRAARGSLRWTPGPAA